MTAPSVAFTASGDVITAPEHGLAVGNKFRVIGINTNNFGDYIVGVSTSPNQFEVTGGIGTAAGFILKHGLSSNAGVSDKTDENLQARAITVFDGETLTLSESGGINANSTTTSFSVSSPGIAGTMTRFPLGSYIQVDNEIMRIASSSLSGTPTNKITVIRGALATSPTSHVENSTIKKIKVPSIEFHRPSIIRASGHTFEYLGYGPGNYSTALPQVQDRTLTEREEFLSQAQERSSGLVVYTGMNNKGDFYIGNQKKSSATGEETNFDIPVPTVTGEDPSRLSAVFDEVTIKERLVVEGGDSGQVLSQFGGPVTFDKDVTIKDDLKVTGDTKLKNLSSTTNILPINDNVDVDGTVTADEFIATTPAFTNLGGNDIYHMLRSNGTQGLITSVEVTNALGFIPASIGSITGDFPLGNSIIVDDISSQFNGTLTDFALLRASAAFVPAGSSANLIVSLGGIIQKAGTDYFIVQSSGSNTNTIRFTTAPLSGTSAFIIGLGGQGSLISNVDWDTKGEIIVATGDNAAAKVSVGQNGYALTADNNATAGVSWQPSVPRGSVFYIASATTPAGYLYCDGTIIPSSGVFQGISVTIDALLLQDLRTLLSTSYGADGQLPNLVNRFAGYSAVPGPGAGSANATLPSHTHGNGTLSAANHRHNFPGDDHLSFANGVAGWNTNTNGTFNMDADSSSSGNGKMWYTTYSGSLNVSGSTASEGVSATNANLPPYTGMRPIIKY